MEFNIPKTKQEMYVILDDLFHYYRFDIGNYNDIKFDPLVIENMTFTEKPESELTIIAKENLSGKHAREVKEREEKLKGEKTKLNERLSSLSENVIEEKATVTTLYNDSVEKIKKQIVKSGLINSTILTDKITILEGEKNGKIIDIDRKYNQDKSQITSEINYINSQLSTLSDYFKDIFDKEIKGEVYKLKVLQDKQKNEVFKYNNMVHERMVRYKNLSKETNATLHLRFLDIKTKEITKEELIEMGYYDDVIKCVSGYYDRLPPQQAYTDIAAEKKLAIYLDHYYQQIVYAYKLGAT